MVGWGRGETKVKVLHKTTITTATCLVFHSSLVHTHTVYTSYKFCVIYMMHGWNNRLCYFSVVSQCEVIGEPNDHLLNTNLIHDLCHLLLPSCDGRHVCTKYHGHTYYYQQLIG